MMKSLHLILGKHVQFAPFDTRTGGECVYYMTVYTVHVWCVGVLESCRFST